MQICSTKEKVSEWHCVDRNEINIFMYKASEGTMVNGIGNFQQYSFLLQMSQSNCFLFILH